MKANGQFAIYSFTHHWIDWIVLYAGRIGNISAILSRRALGVVRFDQDLASDRMLTRLYVYCRGENNQV